MKKNLLEFILNVMNAKEEKYDFQLKVTQFIIWIKLTLICWKAYLNNQN